MKRLTLFALTVLLGLTWLGHDTAALPPNAPEWTRVQTSWGLFGWLGTITHRDGKVVVDVFLREPQLAVTILLTLLLVALLSRINGPAT